MIVHFPCGNQLVHSCYSESCRYSDDRTREAPRLRALSPHGASRLASHIMRFTEGYQGLCHKLAPGMKSRAAQYGRWRIHAKQMLTEAVAF